MPSRLLKAGKNAIGAFWDGLKSLIKQIEDWIKRTIGKLVDFFVAPFRKAWETVSGWFSSGTTTTTNTTAPRRYDRGGIVPGPLGMPQLAVVHGGETILPTHKHDFGGHVTVDLNISGGDKLDARQLQRVAEEALGGALRRNDRRISIRPALGVRG